MRYLLDTHVWLWMLSDPSKIPKKTLTIIQDNKIELFLSAASIWEISIKHQQGKLSLPMSLTDYVATRIEQSQIKQLPIEFKHCERLFSLPMYHNDPFDRMLVAQALEEGLVFISADQKILPYAVLLQWA